MLEFPRLKSSVDVNLEGVSKRYGEIVAVSELSLQIFRGEFFSLLGPSGCGKTTTLRIIGGFETPTSGKVFLREQDVTRVPPYRRATNMVFQHLALFPHLNVFDNIAFGLRLAGLPRDRVSARVHAMLELVDLVGYEAREIRQLSGGQKQRVSIARALVNEPAVLLLDEPLGALDLQLRLQMQAELKALQLRVGTTFIYVTHDQGEALTMSDRIAVMRDGVVEQIGTNQQIYSRPRSRFVAGFIGEANMLDGVVRGRVGDYYRVSVGSLDVLGQGDDAFPPETRVSVVVRPEHVKVGPSASLVENRWEGRVRQITFSGSTIRYRIAVGNEEITADMPNDEATDFGVDELVPVGWRAGRVVLLSR